MIYALLIMYNGSLKRVKQINQTFSTIQMAFSFLFLNKCHLHVST